MGTGDIEVDIENAGSQIDGLTRDSIVKIPGGFDTSPCSVAKHSGALPIRRKRKHLLTFDRKLEPV